jgi:hypothetical protein
MTLDPGDPEGAIAEAASRHSNWGRGVMATCSAR